MGTPQCARAYASEDRADLSRAQLPGDAGDRHAINITVDSGREPRAGHPRRARLDFAQSQPRV
jgi:hypothetical protein